MTGWGARVARPTQNHIIALGRAYVRLIEAASLISGYTEVDEERDRLGSLIEQYRGALRELLAKVTPEIAAQILAVSEKIGGPPNERGLN